MRVSDMGAAGKPRQRDGGVGGVCVRPAGLLEVGGGNECGCDKSGCSGFEFQ